MGLLKNPTEFSLGKRMDTHTHAYAGKDKNGINPKWLTALDSDYDDNRYEVYRKFREEMQRE